MNWNSHLAAIRILSSEVSSVHIVERRHVDQQSRSSPLYDQETYCKASLVAPFEECSEEDIDCETCIVRVEQQQAWAKEFWSSPEGIRVFKMLTGIDKVEERWGNHARETDTLIRELQEFNHMLQDCLQHTQPVFTLELPDEILLKLMSYGSVGEVLLGFKMSEVTRQQLQTELGKIGFALLGSRLISKGFLKANDPIFNHKWS